MNESRLQRRALLIVGIFTALVALLNPGPAERSEILRPSSFFTGDGGARALFDIVEVLGRPVGRWMRPSDHLEEEHVPTLVLLHPSEAITEPEAESMLGWVSRGGQLLFAPVSLEGEDDDDDDDEEDADTEEDEGGALARRLGVIRRESSGSLRLAPRLGEWALAVLDQAPAAIPGATTVFDAAALEADAVEVLFGDDDGGAALVRLEVGAGTVLLLSDIEALTNGGLSTSSLGRVVVRALLGMQPEGTIWFDEFHHGYEEGAGLLATTGRWLSGQHAGWAVIGVLVLLVVTIVFAGVRFGPPLPEPPRPGRSSLEHVDALASAYARARASSRPARLLVEGLRLRLQLPDAAALEQRLHALEATRPDRAADVSFVLAARERGEDLVALSAAIDRLLAVFTDPASAHRPETSRA